MTLEIFKKQFAGKTNKVIMNSTNAIKSKGLYMLDDQSYFILLPNFLDEERHRLLETISKDLTFSTVGRRETHYIGPKYSYSETTHNLNDNWPAEIVKVKGSLECEYGLPLNSVLVNKYATGEQYIPFHQDNEECLGSNPTIFSLTVGEKGYMSIKDKNENTAEVVLYPGSLLIMGGNFNKNYYHSVKRPESQKIRINLTFRYIFSKDNSAKIEEHKSLDQKISHLTKIIKKNKSYAEALSSNNESINKKVVILKSEGLDEEPNLALCLEKLNDHLTEANKLVESNICSSVDHRPRKGPLILELDSIKTKANLLKLFKNNTNIVIRDCLSKNANILRKKAQELKSKKIIKAYWSYRGDIYYLPLEGSDYIKADWGKFNCLMKSGTVVTGRG